MMVLLKRIIFNQRGDIHLFTVFMTLFFFMFISIASTWVGIGANVMHIRNTGKNEMASIAIRIEQDTYQALREGNLAAYEAKLNSSSAYHDQIVHLAKTGIEKNIRLNNENFTVNNVDIHFNRHPDAIEYVLTCDVLFNVNIIGGWKTVRTAPLSFSGRHTIK